MPINMELNVRDCVFEGNVAEGAFFLSEKLDVQLGILASFTNLTFTKNSGSFVALTAEIIIYTHISN